MPLSSSDINILHTRYKKRSRALYVTMHNAVLIPLLNEAEDELNRMRSMTVREAYVDEAQHDHILKNINRNAVETSFKLGHSDSGPDVGYFSIAEDSPLRMITPRDKNTTHITFGYANNIAIPARRHTDEFPVLQRLWDTHTGILAYIAVVDVYFVCAVYSAKSTKDLHATVPDLVRGIGLGDMLTETQPPTRPRAKEAVGKHLVAFRTALSEQAIRNALSNEVVDGLVMPPPSATISRVMGQINAAAIRTVSMVNLLPDIDKIEVVKPNWAKHYTLPDTQNYSLYSNPRAPHHCAKAFTPKHGFVATPDGSFNQLEKVNEREEELTC